MPNRLAAETSPYLLQHAENPVDWYPWGPEALQRSRQEDKPIFLSIGYSACHWCHVMEHESFENERIAALLNQSFVCIKVDREERPDLDQIYMQAVQMMTGHGGWPMSMFLTPDLQPFYGGTYWPPDPRMGMPGFGQVVAAVAEAWKTRRQEALQSAGQITTYLRQIAAQRQDGSAPLDDQQWIQTAIHQLHGAFDFTHGGFGNAPKFPHSMDLRLLLRLWQRTGDPKLLQMVRLNLDKMALGGIYDHLGGGFARYAVDERWLVPHFEKMLYDNALLTSAYAEAYLATGEPFYARVVRETCDYVLQYMLDPQDGFHSTEDADSEGEEGKFYLWDVEEILEVLGPERGRRFCQIYDVTHSGNFEGRNILNLPQSIAQVAHEQGWDPEQLAADLAEDRRALLERRDRRVRPGKDDKILTSWNALMIDALAGAAAALDEPRYGAAAQRAARFLLRELRRDDGRLLHSWRQGRARFDAYLDDYAYLVQALISLHQWDFDEHWIDDAVALADTMLARFHDPQQGGFFFTADDHETLIARQKDVQDSSVPSGNGMAAMALLRLGRLCGRQDYLDAAQSIFDFAGGIMQQSPIAAGQLLLAFDFATGPAYEIVLVAERAEPELAAVLRDLQSRFLPRHVRALRTSEPSAYRSPHLEPLFAGRSATAEPVAFVCQQFTCQAPLVGRQAMEAKWQELGQ